MTLPARQAPIDQRIASALIAATPDHWDAAQMVVERIDLGTEEKMSISISSPQGLRDPVAPTEEIYEYLYQLSDLYRSEVKMWVAVKYNVFKQDDAEWRFSAEFEY